MTADGWQGRFESTLPLQIDVAQYDGDCLHLGGDRWNLNVGCSWRWVGSSGRMISSLSVNAGSEIPGLVGEQITNARWVGPDAVGKDPHFDLRSGGMIEIFSDLPWDSWSLSIPGLALVGPVR